MFGWIAPSIFVDVSTFDLSRRDHPRRLDTLGLGRHAESYVEQDSLAFTYLPDRQLAFVPVTDWFDGSTSVQVIGIGESIREAFPDPTAGKNEPWVAVTTVADKPLPKTVTLAAIKAEPKLKEMALVKYGRLSVQPVTEAEWKLVCKMGGLK